MGQHQQDGQTSLLTALREAYLGRGTGRISIDGGFEIYVRRGEVFFDRDHDLVNGLGPLVARAGTLERPLGDAEMRSVVKSLSAKLFDESSSWTGARWLDDAPKGVELVGPFPAIGVLLEGATYGADEAGLIARLGGESARFTSRDDTPAMRQLPGLDGDMARVLVLLEQPTAVADVLRGGGDRTATLAGLAKLWAIGLAEGPKSKAAAGDDSVVSPKILDRFLTRIREALDVEPSTLDPAEHRGKLARLIGRFGDLDHYQLLGVEATADDAQISAAYDRLARLAHPSHAASLGWTGKEATLRLLFERATEAYLTLCDPLRRSSYNTLMGVHRQLEIDPSTRDEEKRFVARQNFLQAASSLSEADYSTAVDLLKEAVRIDPQAKYYAMLGQAQAKNPNWRHHAFESYRKATELSPDNAGYHLAFAKVCEKLEKVKEAKEHYEAAVDLMPDNVDALEALTRLRGAGGSGKAVTQSLRSVLGRRR